MKRGLFHSFLLLVLAGISSHALAVHVKGHYRNGRWVNGYERRSPGSSSYSRSSSSSAPRRGYGSYSVGPSAVSAQPTGRMGFSDSFRNPDPQPRLAKCAALNANGYPCQLPVNPGYKYCYKHLDYKTPQELAEEREKIRAENCQKHRQTVRTLGMVKREVDHYRRIESGVCPKRISEKDVLDAWENPIFYNTDGTNYVLVSDGPDGIAETDDDLVFLSYTNSCCLALLGDDSQCKSIAVSNELFCTRHLKGLPAANGSRARRNEILGKNDAANESSDESSFMDWFMYANTLILIVVVAVVWKSFHGNSAKR